MLERRSGSARTGVVAGVVQPPGRRHVRDVAHRGVGRLGALGLDQQVAGDWRVATASQLVRIRRQQRRVGRIGHGGHGPEQAPGGGHGVRAMVRGGSVPRPAGQRRQHALPGESEGARRPSLRGGVERLPRRPEARASSTSRRPRRSTPTGSSFRTSCTRTPIYKDTFGQHVDGDHDLMAGLKAWQDKIVAYGTDQGFNVTSE